MKTWPRTAASSVMALALAAATASGAQLADKKAMTLEVAKQMAAAAEKEAANNKWTMVVVVVDDGGNLIYLERMDETQLGSIQVAQEKAKTALQFKRPTKALEDAVAGGRNAVLKLPAMPVEGGLPISVDGRIIGAMGCSGGTSPQDATVCKAGIDALPKILGH